MPADTDLRKVLPPNSDAWISRGFDVTLWKLCDGKIFTPTYHDGNSLSLDKNYDVPDGLTADPMLISSGSEVTLFRGVQAEDENSYSVAVSASLKISGFSSKVERSIAASSKVSTDEEKTTAVISDDRITYSLTRDDNVGVTETFQKAVSAVLVKKDFETFFAKWGTHFLQYGAFGGSFVMRTVLEKSVAQRLSSEGIKSGIEVGFKSQSVDVSSKVSIEQSTRQSLNVTATESSIYWDSVGGLATGPSASDRTAFMNSVDARPMLLNGVTHLLSVTDVGPPPRFSKTQPTFEPIWTLVADQTEQAALKAGWEAYIQASGGEAPDYIPEPDKPAVNAVTRAATDGFLSAWLVTLIAQREGRLFGETDTDANPSTLRVGATLDTVMNGCLGRASMFMPIRKDDHYNCRFITGDNAPTAEVRFQPYGLGFGAWESLVIEHAYPGRAQDGFVVATIAAANDGDQGFIAGLQKELTGDGLVRASIYSSQRDQSRTSLESFCMPVPKGIPFQVSRHLASGAPTCTAFWLPMGPSHRLLALDPRSPDISYLAETNGLLVGSLQARVPAPTYSADGRDWDFSAARLDVIVSADGAFTETTPVVIATTSVEYSDRVRRHSASNSLTCLIRKGTHYKAVLAASVDQPQGLVGIFPNAVRDANPPALYWVGIEPV